MLKYKKGKIFGNFFQIEGMKYGMIDRKISSYSDRMNDGRIYGCDVMKLESGKLKRDF